MSQTIYNYDQAKITNPTAVYSSPNPEDVKEVLLAADIAKKAKANGDFCSCVNFAKRLTGYVGVVGKAKNWPLNALNPAIGEVVVLNESYVGHVAVITDIEADSFTISEANYTPCKRGIRKIMFNNPEIIGFWSKN